MKIEGPFRVQKGPDDHFMAISNFFVSELIGGFLNIKSTAFSSKSKGTFRVYKGPYHRFIKISKLWRKGWRTKVTKTLKQVIQGLLMNPMFQH